nr:hypothetical protein [uncultured Flavobacterium sp.]
MEQPKYSICDKVKLVSDDLTYTIVDVFKEGLGFKYKLKSKNLEYSTTVKESDISSL